MAGRISATVAAAGWRLRTSSKTAARPDRGRISSASSRAPPVLLAMRLDCLAHPIRLLVKARAVDHRPAFSIAPSSPNQAVVPQDLDVVAGACGLHPCAASGLIDGQRPAVKAKEQD
jgi:hypothetical protein